MKIIDVQLPYIGDFYCEIGGITRARDGRFFDALLNPEGVELWAGKVHLIVDRSPRRVPRTVKALAFVAAVSITSMVGLDDVMLSAITCPSCTLSGLLSVH